MTSLTKWHNSGSCRTENAAKIAAQ